MKYALGELIAMPPVGTFQVMLDGTGFLIGNEIPDDLQCDGQVLLFKYNPDDQFATYVPIEKVEKVMGMHEELVSALTNLGAAAFSISNHNHAGMQPLDCLWADLHQCAEHARAVLEKARTA